ncbi:rod shape-determining protein [bacterium]|nr:rod shape-determining protein [bacterium]
MLKFLDKIVSRFAPDLGLDIGSDNIGICECGESTFREAARLLYEDESRERLLAVGMRAKLYEGRTKKSVFPLRPIRRGHVCDYEGALELLRFCISKRAHTGLFGSRVVAAVPIGTADADRQILSDLCFALGARGFYTVISPLASAVGAGLDIFSSESCIVADIGSETTQAAVVCMGGIVSAGIMPSGSRAFDRLIISYCRDKLGLAVGESSAEFFKGVCDCSRVPDKAELTVCGQDLRTGLPKRAKIDSLEVAGILAPQLRKIRDFILRIMQYAPPHFLESVMSGGAILCGGGANLKGLDSFLAAETSLPFMRVQEPEYCTLKGVELSIKDPRIMRAVLSVNLDKTAAEFD